MSTAPTEFDTLADLFLSDSALGVSSTRIGPSPSPNASPSNPRGSSAASVKAVSLKRPIEALVLGHLPVSASAWVVPYARQRSVELGQPVGLIRLDHGTLSLDMVASTPVETAAISGMASTLDEAITAAAPLVGTWILRVSEIAEPEAFAVSGIAGITVLTGADEVATASSFRTIKRLSPRPDGSAVRLAIMGSNPDAAKRAETQIRNAVQTFGEIDLGPSCFISKITATGLRSVFSGDADRDLTSLVTALQSAKAARPTPVMVEPKSPSMRLAPVDTPPAPAAMLAGNETLGPRHAADASSLVGLTALSTRCPYAPEVDLSVDPSGDLHLAVRTGTGTSFLDPGMGVQRLLTAASWVADHAQLLAAVHGDLRAEAALAGPALHLMTDEPKTVRRLLDTGVRVHLLIDANTPGGPVQICRDLN